MSEVRMIADYRLRQILDSRGNPTIEAEVILEDMTQASASVPSGASTGEHEAVEKRDGIASNYLGKSVAGVIDQANTLIGGALIGVDALNQKAFDTLLTDIDGTSQKFKLGANVTLALSLAVARAAAMSLGLPLWSYLGGVNTSRLPMPLMNVLNGGAHADNGLDIQEFMIVPVGASSFSEALRMGAEVYHHLRTVLLQKKLATNVGDEGGFAPNLSSSREALDVIVEAVTLAGYNLGSDIAFALDVAASELYRKGCYCLDGQELNSVDLVKFYQALCQEYPIVSIEDGAAEDDWDTWRELTAALGANVQLVGDDVFVTTLKRIQYGVIHKTANALLVKPNQVGTLTETLEAVYLARRHGYNIVPSHRSGETEDTFIADLAVAVRADQIKIGAPCRTDRVAKYNRLLRIEETLGKIATFSLGSFYTPVQGLLTI